MSTHSLGALIDLSIEVCVGSQNLVKVTPETYLEDLMNEKGITDENTISFVRETFYCVLRYKTLLSRLVDAFFDHNRASIVRADRKRFEILMALAIWKFDELGVDVLRRIIASQAPNKMLVWLKWLFDPVVLSTIFTEVCATYFDINYVQATLVPLIKSRIPHALTLLSDLIRTYPLLAPSVPTSSHLAPTSTLSSSQVTYPSSTSTSDPTTSSSPSSSTPSSSSEGSNEDSRPSSTTPAERDVNLVAELQTLASTAVDRPKGKVTVAVPFNLSAPRNNKKLAPLTSLAIAGAEGADMQVFKFHARPIPKAVTETSLEEIERARAEARAKAKERAEQLRKESQCFQLRSEVQAKEVEQARKERREKKEKEMEEERQRQREREQQLKELALEGSGDAKSIKLTTAAVLRQNALNKKVQDEVVGELKRLAAELRDETEHEEWKKKKAEEEDKLRQEVLAKRKAELARASELAQQAVLEKQKEAKELARRQKEEMRMHEMTRRQELEKEEERKRAIKEKVEATKANVEALKQEIVQEKCAEADEVRRERERARRMIAREAEKELQKRRELIKEVQTMEKIAKARAKQPKYVDRTKGSGLGLLEEMSMAELEARVKHLKEEQKRTEERRRAEIEAERQRKREKLELIMMNNERVLRHKAQERAGVRTEVLEQRKSEEAAEAERDKQVEEMIRIRKEQRHGAKRAAALALARDLRARQEEANLRLASTAMLEQQRLRDLEEHGKRREQSSQEEAEERTKIRAEEAEKLRLERDRERKRRERAKRATMKEIVKESERGAALVEEEKGREWERKRVLVEKRRKEVEEILKRKVVGEKDREDSVWEMHGQGEDEGLGDSEDEELTRIREQLLTGESTYRYSYGLDGKDNIGTRSIGEVNEDSDSLSLTKSINDGYISADGRSLGNASPVHMNNNDGVITQRENTTAVIPPLATTLSSGATGIATKASRTLLAAGNSVVSRAFS